MEGEDNMPFIVATAVVVTLLIAFGLFIVISINSVTYETSPVHNTEYFDVDDPSVDQNLVLGYIPEKTPTVQQYDGTGWYTIDSSYVDWTTGTSLLKVDSGGLVGG